MHAPKRGLRSTSRLRDAHWGNWADTLKMVHERLVADVILCAMAIRSEAPAIEAERSNC